MATTHSRKGWLFKIILVATHLVWTGLRLQTCFQHFMSLHQYTYKIYKIRLHHKVTKKNIYCWNLINMKFHVKTFVNISMFIARGCWKVLVLTHFPKSEHYFFTEARKTVLFYDDVSICRILVLMTIITFLFLLKKTLKEIHWVTSAYSTEDVVWWFPAGRFWYSTYHTAWKVFNNIKF